jgi:SAM-dependent MidA family methyltransferase
MAADILTELETLDALPPRYGILELSAELQQRQRETLAERAPHLLPRVHWLSELPAAGFRGVVLANELLDALPVHGFCIEEDGPRERVVVWDGQRFQWQRAAPGSDALHQALAELAPQLAVGYCSEINLAAGAWVGSIAERLTAGVVLLLDYGYPRHEYYHPQRNTGTLMCHYRHRAHDDPFVYPGLQDITTHVDFTAIAEAAQAAGLQVSGYNTQGLFLLANGITELAEQATDERQRLELVQQLRTLTMPTEMGEEFKVMALSRGYDQPLRGFALQDLRNRL